MDGLNWRHTLVSWINQTNFTDAPIQDIASYDINEFYSKFQEQMSEKREVPENLMDFLKRYYVDFEPDLDENGQIVVQDYMFTYSLFLHFSCLMYPEPFFHSKCIALKPKCQSSIKAFLEILSKQEKFDKHTLRTAIREATPANPRLSFLQMGFSTPQRSPKNFKNSPPTPTSQLLDEKGREVKLLKAQLDSEKYERGFLEVQVKQYEERLSKLMKDQKTYQHEINELNNKILSQETENFSPNRNFKEESAKKRLRERIAEKDEQICDLKLDIEAVRHDLTHMKDKYTYMEKEMRKQMSRVQELDSLVLDLETELQGKIEIIENLQLQIQDLETHISNNRAAVPREVLDSSGDLLDFSFNHGKVNCFTDETESENMGVIIDMKLKEVEHENNELRHEIARHNVEFTAQIKDLLLKIDPEDKVGDAVTLEEHIEAIVVAHKCLDAKHSDLDARLKDVQAELESKMQELNDVTNDRNTLTVDLEQTKAEVQALSDFKMETLAKLEEMRTKATEMDTKLELSNKKIIEIQSKNDELSKELTATHTKSDKFEAELKEKLLEIEKLERDIAQTVEREADLNKMHKILEEDYAKMSESCEKFKAKCAAMSKEGHKLNEKFKETEKRLKESQQVQLQLKTDLETYQKSLESKEEQCKILESDLKASDDKNKVSTNVINQLKEDVQTKESQISDLNSKFEAALREKEDVTVTMSAEIAAKKSEIDQLSSKLSEISQKLNTTIENYEKEKQSLSDLNVEAQQKLETLTQEHSKAISELNSVLNEERSSHSEKISALEKLISDTKDEKISLEKMLEESKTAQENLGKDLERVKADLEKERCATINSQELLNKTIESLHAKIQEKTAEIDQIRLNSELTGDEMTQQINELQVAAMKAAEEKRVFEEKSKTEMETLKESILREKSALMENITRGLEHLVLALSQVQPRIKMLQDMIGNLELQIKDHKDQNQILSLKNIELEGDLSAAKDEISVLEQKIQDHSSHVENLTSNLKEAETKAHNLEKSLSETKDAHSKLFEENKDLKCQNESLSNVATRYSQAIDTGNRQIEELTNDLSNTSQELEHVRSEKISLETEIRSHLQHISQLETDLNAAETEIRQMNEKLQERCAEIEKFQGLCSTETKLVESLNNELDLNKAEKCALTESVKQLESECAVMAEKLDEFKQMHEKITAEKVSLEEQVASLLDEKSVLIQSLDKLSSEHQTVMEENDAINESNKKVIAKLELIAIQKQQTSKNIAALKESVQMLKKENQQLRDEVKTAVEENFKLVAEKMKDLTVFETVGTQVDTLKSDVEAHKTANQELIEKNKEFGKQIQSLQQEIDSLRSTEDALQAKLEAITAEKDEIHKKFEGLSEKHRLSQQEMEEKDIEIRELNQKLDENQAELVKKEGERNLFEAEVKNKEQEIEKLRIQIADQEKLAQEKEGDLQEVTEKLAKLNEKEISILGDIQKLQETNQNLISQVEESQSQLEILRKSLESRESEVAELRKEVSGLEQEKSLLEREQKRIEEDRKSIEEESSRVKQELNDHQATLQAEIAALNLETSQLKEENHKLQQTIFSCEQKLRESESTLDNLRIKSQTEVTELRIAHDNIHSELTKAKEQLEDIQNNVNSLTQQNLDLTATNEKMRLDNETLIKSNEELHVKYVAMCEASSSKADIERLERQFKESDAEKAKQNEKIMEMFKKSQQLSHEIMEYKAKEAKMIQDINILNAKLHKHRDYSSVKEKEYEEKIAELQGKLEMRCKVAETQAVEIRADLEGRLQKMKEKMTMMHNEDIARVKGVHKQELLELRHEHAEVLAKYEKLRATSEKLSKQLHVKNDENLDLLKQNKFMENKIRLMENPSESGSTRSFAVKKTMPPPAFGNMKMEDEPGEEFDNTYLADLKMGRMPDDFGRSSIALSEIQRRNSQWQPHMRSAYAGVFNDEVGEDEIRDGIPLGANDSHMSLLSNGQPKGKKIGGKTAYHRPGPPTPSKNAGRLSFEPGEGPRLSLPPTKEEKPGFRMFRSTKIKDESSSPEMDLATILRRPVVATKKPDVIPVIAAEHHVTKRRQKDFNGNHPDFKELLTVDDYTQYRDKSPFSENEEDSATEEDFELLPNFEEFPVHGMPDESFDAAALNETDATACCPLLVRRRSFGRKENARISREDFKRKSQEKRIVNFNNARAKATSLRDTSSSTVSSVGSDVMPNEREINCNAHKIKLNERDSDTINTTCDFETLMHAKISEIDFNEAIDAAPEDDSTTNDQFNGSRDFTINTHTDFFSEKRVDVAPFYISSRLPQLSRPSEVFLIPRNVTFTVKNQPTVSTKDTNTRNLHLLSALVIVLMLVYILLL
ncbi:GRIP and coiled-coil domain-containing protein 2-like [Culicoides brevitarsis]|uniref:GRIP and coiled-coil domain-containing protein 2-like n=1 Tax=Culicoides brevitarsis TaxID=469753 RepID=UPI00307C4C1A